MTTVRLGEDPTSAISLTVDAIVSMRRGVLLDVDVTENGLAGQTRTFRPRTITESWTTERGYRVMARGPILTTAGREHATHKATAAWDRLSLVPEPLRPLLAGPTALREALRTRIDEATLLAVDPQ